MAFDPAALDNTPLFDVPEKMSGVFDADCKAAGIPKRDGAGRVVDIHALRHTFGTLLARAGVSLQVAQRAMRHSTPVLTANCYTHLGLMDISGAVNALPSIGAISQEFCITAQGGGKNVAPNVAPASGISRENMAIPVISAIDIHSSAVYGKELVLSSAGGGLQRMPLKEMAETTGLEPATSGVTGRRSNQLNYVSA